MKAVGYRQSLPASDPSSLIDVDLDRPVAGPRDLLVRITAVSVNPVDVKMRANSPPPDNVMRILGYDAVGIVEAVGDEAELFAPGDEVFYAGAIDRPGTNAEYHVVDERVVGRKPVTINSEAAAALPLTSLAAWELLFDRLRVPRAGGDGDALLIINGSGGVGSILIQLARKLTNLTVIATASRPETIEWVESLGADHVIDHHKSLSAELKDIGIPQVRYVAGLAASDKHQQAIIDVLKPHGALCMIDDPEIFDVVPFKNKSLAVHWELMFTPTLFTAADVQHQHHILNEISNLIDTGVIRSTATQNYGKINAENLRRAHVAVEEARGVGKIVLAGF